VFCLLCQSYAGKYVPSISHFIVQAAAMHDGTAHTMRKLRALPADVEAPVFKLGGLAIGNGFTEAVEQTLVQVRAWWATCTATTSALGSVLL
jgi:vitellogenic carboxypeptidase-like protein